MFDSRPYLRQGRGDGGDRCGDAEGEDRHPSGLQGDGAFHGSAEGLAGSGGVLIEDAAGRKRALRFFPAGSSGTEDL